MLRNRVKQKLQNQEFVIGTMIKDITNLSIVDILETAGFDYFVIDMEHSRFEWSTIIDILHYARKSDITGIVRVPTLSYINIAKTLDMGAEGIWIPHIDSVKEAEELVSYAKYPPEGIRGSAIPTYREKELDGIGASAEYYKATNDDVLVIAQMESSRAISDVDNIAAVPGIDVLMMGCMDLALDMGYPGQVTHPEIKKSVQKVVDACRKSNITSGNHIADLEQLRFWMQQGMRMITYLYDSGFIKLAGKEAVSFLKDGR